MRINHKIFELTLFSWLLLITTCLYAQNSTIAERKKIAGLSSEKFTEYSPTISADGKTMIFEWNKNKNTLEGEHWELYESRLDNNGNWSEPTPLQAINEKCNFLAGPSLSYDGNTIYFTAFIDKVTTSEDIFYSTRVDDKNWSAPVSVGSPVNTDGYEGFPSVSADGRSLYFIRVNENNPYDKKSKENCFSIYVSTKKENDTWSEPVLLPGSILTIS